MSENRSRIILVSPHQFPDVAREEELARTAGVDIVFAKDQSEFSRLMPQARIVMVTPYGKVTAEEISSLRECAAIVRYGIGYDNIDVRAAKLAGVPVTIVPDASTEEVASHAFAMGLALARRIPHGQAAITAGAWAGRIGYDVPKQTKLRIGILGMGRIGRMTANWWKAVGSQVTAYDPFVPFHEVGQGSVGEIIKTSDVLSLHLPLTDETRNIVDAAALKMMKRSSIVVNVSRGGLIDEVALAEALATGEIAGAALDVFTQEPLPSDSPLRQAPNLILTPHVAWRSDASVGALQSAAVERARLALNGEDLPDRVA